MTEKTHFIVKTASANIVSPQYNATFYRKTLSYQDFSEIMNRVRAVMLGQVYAFSDSVAAPLPSGIWVSVRADHRADGCHKLRLQSTAGEVFAEAVRQ